MIDLNTVKFITIPEGNVVKIRRNGEEIWEEYWDYAWNIGDGFPDSGYWGCPIGGGTATVGEEGLVLKGLSASTYAGLRYISNVYYQSKKAELRVVFKVVSASEHGFRILLAVGENGTSLGRGIQVTVNGGYLNVLSGATSSTAITGTKEISYGEFHEIVLKTDINSDQNEVYLDGVLVKTQKTSDLSTTYASNVWCLAQAGEVVLKSYGYRRR